VFLGPACLAISRIVLDLAPQALVDSSHVPGNRTGHLRREAETSTQLVVGPLLQRDLVADFAVLKTVARDVVEPIAVGQLGVPQSGKLGGRRMQFQLSRKDLFHGTGVP